MSHEYIIYEKNFKSEVRAKGKYLRGPEANLKPALLSIWTDFRRQLRSPAYNVNIKFIVAVWSRKKKVLARYYSMPQTRRLADHVQTQGHAIAEVTRAK